MYTTNIGGVSTENKIAGGRTKSTPALQKERRYIPLETYLKKGYNMYNINTSILSREKNRLRGGRKEQKTVTQSWQEDIRKEVNVMMKVL